MKGCACLACMHCYVSPASWPKAAESHAYTATGKATSADDRITDSFTLSTSLDNLINQLRRAESTMNKRVIKQSNVSLTHSPAILVMEQ